MEGIQFNFKDARLNERAAFCLNKMSLAPNLSFPAIFDKTKELEGFYRFINNENTYVGEIKESIINETKSKIIGLKEALAIHDTTHVIPISKREIDEFQKSRGFFAHLSLLVSTDKTKEIYGAAGLHMWNRSEEKKVYDSEADRWFEQARTVQETVGNLDLIHLMDREGDMCLVWSGFVEHQYRFVIRSKYNRKTKGIDPDLKLREEMNQCEAVAQVEIKLARKKGSSLPRSKKTHPPREKRVATLNISAKTVELHKTNSRGLTIDETVKINVVRVFEINTPPGEEPVEWLLLTTESIEKQSDILRVVELYQCRWVIEEFFKGVKTGCQLEARLLEEADSWYKLFVMYLPIARNILNLRLCGSEPFLSVHAITPIQHEILLLKAKEHNRELKTYKDAYLLIAKMGGYIPTKTPPGWITLLRGYKKLLQLEEGWLLARTAICDKE